MTFTLRPWVAVVERDRPASGVDHGRGSVERASCMLRRPLGFRSTIGCDSHDDAVDGHGGIALGVTQHEQATGTLPAALEEQIHRLGYTEVTLVQNPSCLDGVTALSSCEEPGVDIHDLGIAAPRGVVGPHELPLHLGGVAIKLVCVQDVVRKRIGDELETQRCRAGLESLVGRSRDGERHSNTVRFPLVLVPGDGGCRGFAIPGVLLDTPTPT